MKHSPCYDPETKTDCPKRKAGCNKECHDWDEYVKDRNKVYDERRQQLINNDFTPSRKKRDVDILKWRQRISRRGGKHR